MDAVRILGIVAVVAGHNWDGPLWHNWIYSWHVPLFFYLTGYFWRSNRSFAEEVKARFGSLGKPYIFWFAILSVAYVANHILDNRLSEESLLNPLVGGSHAVAPFTTFWFVSALFFTSLIARTLGCFSTWIQWGVALLGLGLSYVYGPFLASLPLAIGSLAGCYVLLLTGQTARLILSRIGSKARVGLSLLAISAIAVSLGILRPFNIKVGDWGTPIVSVVLAAAIASGLLLVARAAYDRLPAAVHAQTSTVASAGLAVVLTHIVLIAHLPDFGAGAPRFLAAVAVPWAIGLLALRSPLSQWVTGSTRASRVSAAILVRPLGPKV